ncbi:MAG: BBP7 family outer membrane beta-barrel protein [Planctomycetota bacterium]
MRNGFLAAATILVASAASAWSQEPQSSLAPLIQASGEVQPDAAEVLPAPLTQSAPPPENWTPPPLVGSYSYSGNGNRFWGSAEFLLWAIKPGNTPPLVTSGTTTSLGILGEPGTTTLFGGDQDYNARLGGRFTMGYWLDPGQTKGIEGNYFFLNGPSDNFSASSDGAPGSPVLARPYINAITGLPDSELIEFPGVISGRVLVTSSSFFQGAELNGLCNLCCSCPTNCCSTACCQTAGVPTGYSNQTGYRVDMIGGFRYLNLNESLVITENLLVLPTAPVPPFDPGATIMVTDRFETRNSFYGGQIGARGEWYRGAWFTNVSGKVAIGDTHQEVRISGTTVFTSSGGAVVTQPGGLLALPTNIGTYSRDQFSVVPEIGINVGRQLTNNVRVYGGYSLIYWSSVVRPGDQIDFTVNPTQLPTPAGPGVLVGPARPAFAFNDTDFWAHGLNLGLEFRR